VIALWALWACTGEPSERTCLAGHGSQAEASLDGDVALWAPSPTQVPLAWRFEAPTTGPVCATLSVDDGTGPRTVASAGATEDVALPLLGLRADSMVEVSWTLTDTLDRLVDEGTVSFDTPPLPERFPRFEILAHDRARMPDGHVLFDVKNPKAEAPEGEEPEPIAAYLVVLDQDLEVIWWFDAANKIGDVAITPEGLLMGLSGTNALVWDWFGEVQQTWRSNADATQETVVDAHDFHHEVVPMPDGSLWTLSYQVTPVAAYPDDYDNPETLGPAKDLEDSTAIRVLADGTVAELRAMSDVLDTTRIGFDSLDRIGKERSDWVHANGLALDPSDGGLLVSLRHQDAIAKLTAQGELDWMVGSHSGWSEPFQDALLTPIGELSWPYHQHAPKLDDDGTLWVFDNGAYGRTPYDDEDEDFVAESRAVAYRIDPQARTVEQLFEYRDTLTGPLYAPALGGVDPVPGTGDVLVSYGFLEDDGGESNQARGRGTKSVRLIQIHPDRPDEPVFDLGLYSLADQETEGWKSYRAEPIGLLWEIAGP